MAARPGHGRRKNDDPPGNERAYRQQDEERRGHWPAGELAKDNGCAEAKGGDAEDDAQNKTVLQEAQPFPPEFGPIEAAIDGGETKVHKKLNRANR